MGVKRWESDTVGCCCGDHCDGPEMEESPTGGFVTWEDHEAAIAETTEAVSRATADAIHEAYRQVSIKALEDAIK